MCTLSAMKCAMRRAQGSFASSMHAAKEQSVEGAAGDSRAKSAARWRKPAGEGVALGRGSLLQRPTKFAPSASISRTVNGTRTSKKWSARENAEKAKQKSFIDIVPPAPVDIPRLQSALGVELDREEVSRILECFARRPLVRELCEQNRVTRKMFHAAYKSFRDYCFNAALSNPCIAVVISDILKKARDVDCLYPYFIEHARKVYPHLECERELKTLSDLSEPHNWYPKAREVLRKIVFHAGPTNSGKTHEALRRFYEAKTGFYCGPLRLLAGEVAEKTNKLGIQCDLVTGEERRYAVDCENPSSHVAMTVEMVPVDVRVEVAVIDEIQMLRDLSRGWAWTRALLGIAADEIHLCGEVAAVDIVRSLLDSIGEHVEVQRYERKTPLLISEEPLSAFSNVQDGDCLVCFSVSMLFSVARSLMKLGIEPTVVYGALPPWTKLNQAKIFNEMKRKPNVMVATDAIGMGLNLNIRRVVFVQFPFGEHQANFHVVQVAGRAGRFRSAYEKGWVTTLKAADLPILESFMKEPIEPVVSAGIAPTCEQLEAFSFHLPHASFLNIIDMFISISSLSQKFHLCDVEQLRRLAELIDDIPLGIKVRYAFCTAPVDIEVDNGVARACFVRLARRFSDGLAITFDWFCESIQWPLPRPTNVSMLLDMCKLYNLIDLYLWLSYKFPDMFPDRERVRQLGVLIEGYISEAIAMVSSLTSHEAAAAGEDVGETTSLAGSEKVAERLLRSGALSENDLSLLREEIRQEELAKLLLRENCTNSRSDK